MLHSVASSSFPRTYVSTLPYTYRQPIGVALLRAWFSYASTVEFRFPLSLEPGKEKDRTSIKPSPLGGSWYPHAYRSNSDTSQRVVLHFHGGAYVMNGARDSDVQTAQKVIADGLQSIAFFPQYRLSSYENCVFPAALQDAVTSYKYLLNQGIAASRIVFSGDSAGGNLALALLRYVQENPGVLPLPAATLLWSPWVDIAYDLQDFSVHRNESIDWVPTRVVEWGARVYSGDTPKDNPYLSPARHTFFSGVPMFAAVGTNEILYDGIGMFVQDMQGVKGNKVTLVEISNAPHDTMLAGIPLGFLDEAMEGARQALRWLEEQR